MPIKELDNFRAKYPQYNDISDVDLANKLASKYPAYSDLPGKVGNQPSQPQQNPNRFPLKSSQPYDSYSYMDAAKDTGKTLINSAADLGQNTINTVKSIPQIPGAIGNAFKNPGQAASSIAQGIGDKFNEYNSMDKIANKVSTDPFGFGSDVVGAATIAQGGSGILKSGIKMTSTGASNFGKFLNFDQKALSLGNKVRTVAAEAKQSAVDKFGLSQDMLQKIDPNTNVSMREVVDNINSNMGEMAPEAKNILRRVPLLKDMLNKPELADKVSLADSQSIINYLNTKVPAKIKYNHLDILDTINDTKVAQLDAFPEMAGVRAEYGKFAEDYKLLRSALNPKQTPNAILSNFSNNIAVKDAASRILSPVLKEMSKLRGQVGTVNLLKKLGLAATGLEGIHLGYKAITGR